MWLLLVALLCSGAVAYVVRARARLAQLQARVSVLKRRESDILEAARIVTAASRESAAAVLGALDTTLRVLEPALDAVLVFTPELENLQCTFASGARAERFPGARLRRDDPAMLPALAAQRSHRVQLAGSEGAVIPTDRDALAVPMLAGNTMCAVVYAAMSRGSIGDADLLACAVAQAAAPYMLAADREADREQATFDGLTGLYTPRAFRELLQRDAAAAGGGMHRTLALWFIDTDHFKLVNDTLGHAAGDRVLQMMGALVRAHVTGADTAARNGGDEFCAILRGVQKIAAIERAQRFCRAVREQDFGEGIRITASIGVAALPFDANSADELLEKADAAMYHSKRSGRDCVSFAAAGGFAVYT